MEAISAVDHSKATIYYVNSQEAYSDKTPSSSSEAQVQASRTERIDKLPHACIHSRGLGIASYCAVMLCYDAVLDAVMRCHIGR